MMLGTTNIKFRVYTLFACLRMFRTNAELFGVCIIALFAVSKTLKLMEKSINYKRFHSCVQILFIVFFPIR